MTTTTPDTHAPDWHAARAKGIGASEIGVIAGLSPWGSRWALWAEKTGLLPPDTFEQTEAMTCGTDLEPWLAEQFTKRTGLVVAGEQMMLTSQITPWARATVDGIVFDSHQDPEEVAQDLAYVLGGFEAKYHSGAPWDEVPAHYLAQASWQMYVAGWERVWFGVLHSFGRYRIYEVERDEALIGALLDAATDFWELVQTNTPPALGGPGGAATAKALSAVFGEGGGGEVDLSHLAGQHAALRTLKDEAAALESQIVDLANELKAALGDGEVGLIDGRPLVTWKRSKGRKTFDWRAHAAARAECHEGFVTVGDPERRLDVRVGCEWCAAALRPQDVAAHMKRHEAAP